MHSSLATDKLSKPHISNDWMVLCLPETCREHLGTLPPALNKRLQGICVVAANSPTRSHSSSRLRKLDLLMKARESDPQNCRVRKALKPLYLGWGCFVFGAVPYGVEMRMQTAKKR